MLPEAPKFNPQNPEDVSLRMDAIWDDEPDAYLVQRAGGDAEYLRLLRNHEVSILDAEVYPGNDHIQQQLDETTVLLNYYETSVVSKKVAREQAQQSFTEALDAHRNRMKDLREGEPVTPDELDQANFDVKWAARTLRKYERP